MRRQLFAYAASVALLLAAASPALAHPGKGQANGHDKAPKTKPAKDPKPPKAGRVNGGGVSFKGAEFSVQARQGQPRKGHFNYTSADGSLKVRCKDVTFTPMERVMGAAPGAEVTDADCMMRSGKRTTPVTLNASFFDHGQSGDVANIIVADQGTAVVEDSGPIKEGNIQVR